ELFAAKGSESALTRRPPERSAKPPSSDRVRTALLDRNGPNEWTRKRRRKERVSIGRALQRSVVATPIQRECLHRTTHRYPLCAGDRRWEARAVHRRANSRKRRGA